MNIENYCPNAEIKNKITNMNLLSLLFFLRILLTWLKIYFKKIWEPYSLQCYYVASLFPTLPMDGYCQR